MTAPALRVLWVSLTTSVVLLPLLVCSRGLLRRYRAGSCALLWLLLALRLLIPVQLPLSHPPVRVEVPGQVLTAQLAPEEQAGQEEWVESKDSPLISGETGLSVGELMGLVWMGGVVLTLSFQVFLCLSARKGLVKGAKQVEEDELLVRQLGGRCPVLRTQVATPMTLGLIRPVILLPEGTPRGDLPMILRHELCHIRRGDLWYKALLGVCACVHWFNPLVWKLGRVAGETLELCCDEAVVAGEDAQFRRSYGQVLLRSAAAGEDPGYAVRFGSGDLKGRLMNLFITKKTGAGLVCISLCAALSMASLVGCEVSAARAEPVQPEQSIPISVEMSPNDSRDVVPPAVQEKGWLWPVEGYSTISAACGERTHPITGEKTLHDGVDIPAPQGTAVICVRSGTVSEADFDSRLGNFIRIEQENGYETVYAHLSDVLVAAGEQVAGGQTIGAVGATGMATGAHLHITVRDSEKRVYDPLSFYPGMTFQMQAVTKDLGLAG